MHEGLKGIGRRLRELIAGIVQRPLGWKEIDKLTEIDEREEALQRRDKADEPPRR